MVTVIEENVLPKMHNKVKMIVVGQTKIDPSYQRGLRDSHVAKLAREWNPLCFGVAIVNVRADDPDTYWVIDGQQRIQALRNIGVEESFQIPAVVLELEGNGDVVKEEASVFNQINMGKMKLSRLENFWGLIRSGDNKANDILKRVEKAGLKIAPNGFYVGSGGKQKGHADNYITAIGALYDVYAAEQGSHFDELLGLINEHWRNKRRNTLQFTILGLAKFIITFSHATFYSKETLIETMKRVDPVDVHQIAVMKYSQAGSKQDGLSANSSGNPFAKALIDAYNLIADDKISVYSAKWLELPPTVAIEKAKSWKKIK